MTTEMLERPTEEDITLTDEDGDDDECHICCPCSPRLAFCGRLLSEWTDWEDDDYPNVCDECEELGDQDCPRCGE